MSDWKTLEFSCSARIIPIQHGAIYNAPELKFEWGAYNNRIVADLTVSSF